MSPIVTTKPHTHWLCPAILALAAVLIFFTPALAPALEYSRPAILAGQYWRTLTGHLTHFTTDHLLWDTLTMLVLGILVAQRSLLRFAAVMLGGALAISASLLIFLPDLQVYRGLSGVDSALFICAAILILQEARRERHPWKVLLAAAAILAFLAKTLFELATGRVIFVQDLGAGVTPIVLAHLAGAAWGALAATLRRPTSPRFDLDWLIAGT